MKFKVSNIFLVMAIFLLSFSVFGQSKKNARPDKGAEKPKSIKKDLDKKKTEAVYLYEFSQPKFILSKVIIEHDDKGIGKIMFKKRDFNEFITEPLKLSEKTFRTLERLWLELNFLDSDEVYQSKRDYSHLGEMKFTIRKDNKERIASFNWTENLNAKALADEYRKIGNQFVWIFDMNVSRENQPLESPRIMTQFDRYLQRNEFSDLNQLMPFLKGITDDERFPLITRNHATRLLKKLEKKKENKKDKLKK